MISLHIAQLLPMLVKKEYWMMLLLLTKSKGYNPAAASGRNEIIAFRKLLYIRIIIA
jgi:hypothetical protein